MDDEASLFGGPISSSDDESTLAAPSSVAKDADANNDEEPPSTAVPSLKRDTSVGLAASRSRRARNPVSYAFAADTHFSESLSEKDSDEVHSSSSADDERERDAADSSDEQTAADLMRLIRNGRARQPKSKTKSRKSRKRKLSTSSAEEEDDDDDEAFTVDDPRSKSATHKKHKKKKWMNKDEELCHVCGRTFSRIGNLNRHMNTHSAKKQHHCDVCGKNFRERHHLLNHLDIHSNFPENPIVCEFCPQRIKGLAQFKAHLAECRKSNAPPTSGVRMPGERPVLVKKIKSVSKHSSRGPKKKKQKLKSSSSADSRSNIPSSSSHRKPRTTSEAPKGRAWWDQLYAGNVQNLAQIYTRPYSTFSI